MRKSVPAAFLVMSVSAVVASMLLGSQATAATKGTHGSASLSAAKQVTPGWECVPKKAGQPVLSGGTAASPSCHAGTTAVLAPTYVSKGVGGKPTAEFSRVNVQIVSGSGSTSGAVNGRGNLVVGYAENAKGYARTGSNNLIVGSDNGWTSYGAILGGFANQASARYTAAFGANNRAAGNWSFIAGRDNETTGAYSSVTGGLFNLAAGVYSDIVGGCDNLVGTGSSLTATCIADAEAILGGFENTATGLEATVAGGEVNDASGGAASVAGGQFNDSTGGGSSIAGGNDSEASGSFASILGGFNNFATTFEATVSGGEENTASANGASVLGGDGNNASSNCQAIPAAPGTC